MDHRCIPQQALFWEVLEFKRGRVHPRTDCRGAVKKAVQKWEITWEEREGVAVYDKDDIKVFLNASTWTQAEYKSKSR